MDLETAVGPIDHVILFGSGARGERGPDSDVDLIIVSSAFAGMTFYERAAAARRVWKEPIAVDLICYTPEEFARLRGEASLVRVALDEGTEVATP